MDSKGEEGSRNHFTMSRDIRERIYYYDNTDKERK
jgi:hypothetical protein